MKTIEKINIKRVIQDRPSDRKDKRNEKIKEALNEHVEVQVIPAKSDRDGYEKPKPRVCAYCRVSTDMDTQALSYELQVQNYTTMDEIAEIRNKGVSEKDFTPIAEFDEEKVKKFITKVMVSDGTVTFVFYNGVEYTRAYTNGQPGNKPGWNKKEEI